MAPKGLRTGDDEGQAPEPATRLREHMAEAEGRRLKLNFDGSSRRVSWSASIGGVVRDHEGNFVLGYAESIGEATSSVAELAALRRGLELALENGWRGISVEGDFKTAADAIGSRARVRATKDLEQWNEISRLLRKLGGAAISHVPREGNKVADGFAKLGHRVAAERRLWRDVPPDEVLEKLRRDAELPRTEEDNDANATARPTADLSPTPEPREEQRSPETKEDEAAEKAESTKASLTPEPAEARPKTQSQVRPQGVDPRPSSRETT